MRPYVCLTVLIAFALAACSGSSSPSDSNATPPAEHTAAAGSITGTVVVHGGVPPAGAVRLDADPQCASLANGEARTAEDILVGDGNGLQNVFVYVKQGLPTRTFPVPSDAAVLDQQECRYVPRVLGIQAGQPFVIRNSDPLLHTVRAEGTANQRFNVATPVRGMEVKRTFREAEVMVPVKCDMHPWMTAYVGVLDHPFFDVTDDSGRFSLNGLPRGTYTIEIWHERFGAQSHEVSLSAGETKAVAFTFNASS
jgi:hypothetical protein